MSNYLTPPQIELLLKRIHPQRVLSRQGMAYVEAHDIKAELSRVFGFARWSSDVVQQELVFESQVTMGNDKPGWNVCYRSVVKLTVHAPDGTPLATYTEGHVGDSTHPVRSEAHGNAVTNSESYALKRCAIALGDQFGLSLYNKGSLAPLVRWTLVQAPGSPQEDVNTDDVPEIAAESERADDKRETNAVPEPTAEEAAAGSAKDAEVEAIRAAALADPGTNPHKYFAELQLRAVRGRVQRALTSDAAGNAVTVKALLDAQAKQHRRAS